MIPYYFLLVKENIHQLKEMCSPLGSDCVQKSLPSKELQIFPLSPIQDITQKRVKRKEKRPVMVPVKIHGKSPLSPHFTGFCTPSPQPC